MELFIRNVNYFKKKSKKIKSWPQITKKFKKIGGIEFFPLPIKDYFSVHFGVLSSWNWQNGYQLLK
jgi:hypothetical protein